MSVYPDDFQRMDRLAEEVRAKLEELALIGSRIGGFKLDPRAVRKFSPRLDPYVKADDGGTGGSADAGAPSVVAAVEIFDSTPQHPEMCVVWWSDGTHSLDSPCGHEIYHSH